MRIYINGVDLNKVPVVQNETGRFYGKSIYGPYWKPLLKDFDTATPPAGYNTYTQGSHASYLYQRALDFEGAANLPVTFDEDVTVETSTPSDGSYCIVRTSVGRIFLVHTDRWKTGVVKAGTPVCYIKAISAPHLHIFLSGGWIRNVILATDNMNKGDRIEWIKDTNIRQGNGLSYPINATAKQGAVATLRSSEVRKTDGYEWMDVQHPSVTGWAVVQNMKATTKPMTNVDGSAIAIPKPCDERIQEAVDSTTKTWSGKLAEEQEAHKKTQQVLVEVNAQKKELETELARTKQDLTLCIERNEFLEQEIKDFTKLLKEASDRILSLEDRNRKLEADNAKLKAELEECQSGVTPGCLAALAQLANKLLEWLNGNKLSLGLQNASPKGKESVKDG